MLPIALVSIAISFAALVTGGGRWRRRIGVALGLAALPLPLAGDGHPAARFVAALGAGWGLARLLDLYLDRRERPAAVRVWQMFSILDTRAFVRARPLFDPRLAFACLAFGGGAALAFALAHREPPDASPAWTARWAFGLVGVYCVADAAGAFVRFFYRAIGLDSPRIHRTPIASRSLAEFWGDRWNRVVGTWLRGRLFVPFARRGRVGLGVAAAFGVSAALHAYLVLVSAGARPAAIMGAFFVAQGVLLLVERAMRVAKWPRAAAHAWFLATMIATTPLFVMPGLEALGV
jgi:hypothetical protein